MTIGPEVGAPATHTRRRLLRVFGVVFGLAVIVGNTIAAGILRTPGDIATRLPTPALFFTVWIAGAAYALLGALNLAELGAMLPRSGGQYVFARHAFGPYTGFVIGWSDWLSTCASIAAVAIVIGESTGTLVPVLAPYRTLLAATAVLAFTLLIWRGARESGRTQATTSLLKALVLVTLVAACFLLPHADAPAVTGAAPTGTALLTALVLGLQSVIYTYDGWNGVLYFSEEIHDPGRDIPRSMLGGVLSVAAVYILLNLAFAWVLSVPRMAGEPFAAAAAARALFGTRGYSIVSLLTIAVLLSSMNALLLMASRVPVAMSRDGLFPTPAAAVDARGTPTVSLLASAAVALLFIVTGAFDAVLALAAFYFVFNYVVSFSALFLLRRREPTAPRPYHAWGYPWTTGVALAGSVAFLVGAVAGDRRHSIWALAVLALSYPIYRLTSSR
jgi:APA family basic amino acid/polyamine antiporter